MEEDILVKEAEIKELEDIKKLITKNFNFYEKDNFSKNGRVEFLNSISEEELKERRNSGSRFIIAKGLEEIKGVMEVRPYNYINLFFIKKNDLELTKKLIKSYSDFCDKPKIINAPIYLEETFNSLGLEKLCKEQEVEGVKFIPYKFTF